MTLELTTPALLFTSISLLISAYTSRFLSLAQLLRQLDIQYKHEPNESILGQIRNLNKRLSLIRYSQIMGGLSFFLCTLSTFLLFRNLSKAGEVTFGASLIALMISIVFLLIEVHISVKALSLQLKDFENEYKQNKKL
jgi:hypothetical protein